MPRLLPLHPSDPVLRRAALPALVTAVVLGAGLPLLATPPAQAEIARTETTVVGDRVYRVDTSTQSEDWSYSTGEGVGYSAANDLVWTSAADLDGWGALVAYDPATLDVAREVTPRGFTAAYRTKAPDGLAVDDERGLVWASAGRDNAVLVVEQATGNPVAKIGNAGVGTQTGRSIALDPVLDRVYLSSYDHSAGAGQITVIDAATRAVLNRWDGDDLGLDQLRPVEMQVDTHDGASGLYFTNAGRLVEVADSAATQPQVRVVTDRPELASYGFTVSRRLDRAYLTNAGATADGSEGGIVTIDLATGEVLDRVQVMDGQFSPFPIVLPHANAVVDEDRGEVYVGGAMTTTYSRDLTMIDAESGALIGETKVPDGAVFQWPDDDGRGGLVHHQGQPDAASAAHR